VRLEVPDHPAPSITLSPLIDVVFILLVFVVLAARFVDEGELDVTLPEAVTEPADEPRTVVVEIDAGGSLAVDGEPILAGDLDAALAARAQHSDRLVLLADRHAYVQAAVDVMASARAAGFTKVGMGTQPPGQ